MHLAVFLWISLSRCFNLTFKMSFQWMMHSNWLQVELKGLLGRLRREGVAWQFCKNQIESGRVARETSEGKDKIKSNKSTDLKGPAVTQLIMSIQRKDERRNMKRSKNWRVTRLGGTQAVCWFCLNIWKLEVTGTFFPGKTCKPFACKRNYFVLQSGATTFSCWGKA